MSHRTRLLTVSFAAAAPVRNAWRRKLLAGGSVLALNLAAIAALQPALAQPVTTTGDVSSTSPTGTPPVETPDWTTGDLTIGVSGTGTGTVQDGGWIWTEGVGTLGKNAGSSGTMTVTGAASAWDTVGEMIVGGSGTGTLVVEDGGHVRASYEAPSNNSDGASIGLATGSVGHATVTGDGSMWEIYEPFKIGDAGQGILIVEDGGEVSNVDAYLGYQSGSRGDATVTGQGSQWSTGKLVIGAGGVGTLTLEDFGWVITNGDSVLGSDAGSTGTATVSGSGVGLGWSIRTSVPGSNSGSGNFTIGDHGTGILIIEDGGLVTSTAAASVVGNNGGSEGTVTISGQDSAWGTSLLRVGNSGTGTVTVEEGGSLDTGAAYLGFNSASTGTVTVTGDGSTWNDGKGGDDIYVGYSGTGILNIADVGAVVTESSFVGYNKGSIGTVTVTGNGGPLSAEPVSTWITSDLQVGSSGEGHLTIEKGGQVTTEKDSVIGSAKGSTGTVTVTDEASVWYQLGGLTIGSSGNGTLNIKDGGEVLTDGGDSYLASEGGSIGTVTVSGQGASWDTDERIVHVGFQGRGTLTIEDGASMSARTLTVAGSGELVPSNARGDVTVTGEGSQLDVNTLYLGNGGQSSLTVDGGGMVTSGAVLMGYIIGAGGTINLNGSEGARGVLETTSVTGIGGVNQFNFDGGILRAPGNIRGSLIDSSPSIHVNLLAGGAFIDTNGFDVGLDPYLSGEGGLTKLGEGTLTLSGGNSYKGVTQVEAGTLLWGGGYNSGGFVQRGQYVINGGTLDLGSGHGNPSNSNNYSLTMASLSGNGGTVKLNTANLIVDQATDTEYEGSIAGSGGLTKKGTGSLTLAGDSTYTGGTTVDDGTLVVNGSLTGDVQVNADGTLGGTGTIGGNAVNGGTLAAGNSIGTLTIGGDFTQEAGGVLAIEADFANASIDRLVVGGDARLAGAIRIDAKSVLPDVELSFLTVGGTLTHLLDAESSLFDYELVQREGELSLSAGAAHFAEPGAELNDDQQNVAAHLQEVWDAGGGSFGALFGTLGSLADADPAKYASALSDLSFGASGAAAASSIVMTQQHLDLLLSCPTFAAGSAVLTETECVWSQAGGQRLDQKASGGISGFDNTTYSLQAGVQREVSPDWFVGFAGGYDRSSIDSDDDRVSADGDTLYAGVSLKHEAGPRLLSGALAGSYGWFDNTRAISIPGFAGRAEGDQDIYNLSARARAAYTIAYDNSYVRPLVDLDLIYAHAGGYRERGAGALDLAVDDASQWSFHVTPAVEVGTRVALGETTVMRAFAAAGVSFGTADSWDTSARLANAPTGVGGFDSAVPLADVVGRLTAGVDLANDNGFSVRAQYSGAFSDTYTSHGGSLRLSYKF